MLDIGFLVNMVLNVQNQMDEAYDSTQLPSSGTAFDVLFEEVPDRVAQHQAEEECVLPKWHYCCYYSA